VIAASVFRNMFDRPDSMVDIFLGFEWADPETNCAVAAIFL
jgi:hypothetical protein